MISGIGDEPVGHANSGYFVVIKIGVPGVAAVTYVRTSASRGLRESSSMSRLIQPWKGKTASIWQHNGKEHTRITGSATATSTHAEAAASRSPEKKKE